MPPSLSRSDFERLLAKQQHLVELVNELEFYLYQLGETPASEAVVACQQAAGALIAALRNHLFHQDQLVLPLLETTVKEA
jgi:hypothetical protein